MCVCTRQFIFCASSPLAQSVGVFQLEFSLFLVLIKSEGHYLDVGKFVLLPGIAQILFICFAQGTLEVLIQ